MNTVLARRALTTTALAALALTGATAPALAAPAAVGTPVVTGNGGLYGNGPEVAIRRPGVTQPVEVGANTIIQPGRPVELSLQFKIGGVNNTYSDVHFSTSNPGTAAGCDMSTIYADMKTYGAKVCKVTLPSFRPGEVRRYSVTMTGKKNGQAFAITQSTTLTAHDVRVSMYVDGKRVSGRVAAPAKGSFTVEYIVGNYSKYGLWNVADFADEAPRCSVPYVAPGTYKVCKYTMTRAEVVDATKRYGGYQMMDLHGSLGGLLDVFGTNPRTTLVAQ